MAVNLSPIWGAGAQLLDNSGNVLTGGKIYTYAAGTTTPATTFTSSNGGTANSNPIILNSAGRVPYEIWLTDGVSYKFVLKDSNDTLIATYDNLIGINSNFVNFTNQQEIQTATAGQTVFNLVDVEYQPGTNSLTVFVDGVNQYGPGAQYAYVETDSNTVTFVSGLHVGASVKFTTSQLNSTVGSDATQVSYEPPFTNSVATNVAAKLAQTVSVKDFGAVGDGVTDDAPAINQAIAYMNSVGGGVVTIPPGTYLLNETTTAVCITMLSNVWLQGSGIGSTILYQNNNQDCHTINAVSCTDIVISDLTVDGNRTNQSSVGHGIRGGNGWTRGTIQNVQIKNSKSYSIGIQSGTVDGLFINSVQIVDSGIDGIDIKNANDNNKDILLNDVVVNGFDLENATGKAGIDIRGPAELSNIVVNGVNTSQSSGIRFRQGEASTGDLGAHQSVLTNFRVTGSDVANTIGVGIYARNVSVSNGYVSDCDRGVLVFESEASVVNTTVNSCATSGFFTKDFNTTLTGDNSIFTSCTAQNCGIGIEIDGTTGNVIQGCRLFNNTTGAYFRSGSGEVTFVNNVLSGNTTSVNNGATILHANSNIGWKTEGFYYYENVPVDSVGTKTFTITHDLDVAPPNGSVQATVRRNTAVNDYQLNPITIGGASSSVINGYLRVFAASATAGAVVNINVYVKCYP